MSDGPDLGLHDSTAKVLPDVPAGWTAYPSLGGGFGAKKWFDAKQGYEDVVTGDADLLSGLCSLVDEKFAPPAEAEDAFEQAVEAPAEQATPADAADAAVADAPAEEPVAPADNATA